MKREVLFVFLLSIISFLSSVLADPIVSYGVDGSSNNLNVVIKNRNPIAFFKVDTNYTAYSFEIKISSYLIGTSSGNFVWTATSSVNSNNTINNLTRIEIPSSVLQKNLTYYMQLTVYYYELLNQISTSTTVFDKFYTVLSAVNLTSEISLEVDFNNPFCPKMGETTKIRYMVKNKDTPIDLYLFSISGKYIKILASHLALKDVVYTITWDGKDEKGEILPQGVYIVALRTIDAPSVIRYVGVVDKK